MTEPLRARPPTRDEIARVIRDGTTWKGEGYRAERVADALLAEFSIVARGDTPPPQTAASADEAFETWLRKMMDVHDGIVSSRDAFRAGAIWARAAVGDSPPAEGDANAETNERVRDAD